MTLNLVLLGLYRSSDFDQVFTLNSISEHLPHASYVNSKNSVLDEGTRL